MSRHVAVALLIALSLGLVGSARGATEIGPAALARLLRTNDVVLVNVHVPYHGEIEGTDVFVPFNAIETHRDRLPERRDTRLVVYCRGGMMGAIAATTLARLGYTNVSNLEGGMAAWERQGYPLVRRPR